MDFEAMKRIVDGAPDGATHYGYDYDDIIYFYARSWGYHYCGSDNLVDEYEAHLFNIKPL